ncbi:hypothetical protein M5K25_021141 [Dendrobium thyrsiflorum]|uniref:Uncharacterized protein n=1 Tax=Dendrobium thyrsiflorum TaxID=117978 RepID=A0ABD0UBM3_DENTH
MTEFDTWLGEANSQTPRVHTRRSLPSCNFLCENQGTKSPSIEISLDPFAGLSRLDERRGTQSNHEIFPLRTASP